MMGVCVCGEVEKGLTVANVKPTPKEDHGDIFSFVLHITLTTQKKKQRRPTPTHREKCLQS